MSINSASDAKRFKYLTDRQLVLSPKEALISGRYSTSNIVTAFKEEYIRYTSYEMLDQFVMMSKNFTARPDSGLSGYSDEEISELAHDKSLLPSERKRFQTEEKVRGLRNKQKRENYNKKKGKGNHSKVVLPDPDELYNLDNFKEAVDNLYVEELPINQPSFWDVLGGDSYNDSLWFGNFNYCS